MFRKIYDAVVIATGEKVYVHKDRNGDFVLKTSRVNRRFKPSELIIKNEQVKEQEEE